MKPSDVVMFRSWIPLVDTFGRTELEWAAALLVRTCQLNGDVFAAHPPKAIGETMKRDRASRLDPWAGLMGNPFLRPDFRGLAEKGFVEFLGDVDAGAPVQFTAKGLVVLEHAHEGRIGIAKALAQLEVA